MLKPIKNWLQHNALAIAIVVTILLVFLSLVNPASITTSTIKVSDKVLHTLAYTGLMWSWLSAFRNNINIRNTFFIFVILIFFGVMLEWAQGELTTSRTADWKDAIANTIGLIIGAISFKILNTKIFNN